MQSPEFKSLHGQSRDFKMNVCTLVKASRAAPNSALGFLSDPASEAHPSVSYRLEGPPAILVYCATEALQVEEVILYAAYSELASGSCPVRGDGVVVK